jgi:hypothetical protein
MAKWVKREISVKKLFAAELKVLQDNGTYLGTGQLSRALTVSNGDVVSVIPMYSWEHYGKFISELPAGTQPVKAYQSVELPDDNPTL